MLISIFSRLTRQKTVSEKIAHNAQDVYLYILFPITVAFLITFAAARFVSYWKPNFFLHIVPGLHIHHYLYGIVILTVSGYLALCATKPRDRYLISLLHGFGLGLAYDEFGYLLHLSEINRFSYDGVAFLIGLFILLISAEKGVRMWQRHFRKKGSKKHPVLEPRTVAWEAPPQA